MFREMRRKGQQLSDADCAAILDRGTSGVLALKGDDGYPYAVPVNYLYSDGAIYFHSAKTGHKTDAIRQSQKASFCVVDQDQVVPQEWTTYFRSVIIFGQVAPVGDEAEKRRVMERLALRYGAKADEMDQSAVNAVCVLKLSIAHMTGKEAIQLVKAGQA